MRAPKPITKNEALKEVHRSAMYDIPVRKPVRIAVLWNVVHHIERMESRLNDAAGGVR